MSKAWNFIDLDCFIKFEFKNKIIKLSSSNKKIALKEIGLIKKPNE